MISCEDARRRMLTNDEVTQTLKLCEQYGYGHIMELASALWRRSLSEKGLPTNAAFVPTISSFIKDDCRFQHQQQLYDLLVKKYFREQDGGR